MKEKYIAFLRGINVGGHHKVPMGELRAEMEKLGFEAVTTILNTGNILFDTNEEDLEQLEKTISAHLEKIFGFPIPTILRKWEMLEGLLNRHPFKAETITKDIRLYVSFLKIDAELPWTSEDKGYKIIEKRDKAVLSVLDVTALKTTKAMGILERQFGKKNITTRNWNTIKRIEKKCSNNRKLDFLP